MVSKETILKNIPPAEGQETVNFQFGSNQNIIDTITGNLQLAIDQTKNIAPYFLGSTLLETVYNIQQYLVKNITYIEDGLYKQAIRLPSDLLHNEKGDCKSFALFATAILANLYNLQVNPLRMRFASYDPITMIPGHVYTVVYDYKTPIILDAVYQLFGGRFNTEKPAQFIKDYNIMRISTITGTGGNKIGCCGNNRIGSTMIGASRNNTIIGKIKVKSPKEVAAELKEKAAQLKKYKEEQDEIIKKKAKEAAELAKDFITKNVFYSQRGAFQTLIRFNFRGWANILDKNMDKALKMWTQWGGDEKVFKAAVAQGLKRKPILAGKDQKIKLRKLEDGTYEVEDWGGNDPNTGGAYDTTATANTNGAGPMYVNDPNGVITMTPGSGYTVTTGNNYVPGGNNAIYVPSNNSGLVATNNNSGYNMLSATGVNAYNVSGTMIGRGIGDAEGVAAVLAAAATIIVGFASLLNASKSGDNGDTNGQYQGGEDDIPDENGGNGSGNNSGGNDNDNEGFSTEDIQKIMTALGVTYTVAKEYLKKKKADGGGNNTGGDGNGGTNTNTNGNGGGVQNNKGFSQYLTPLNIGIALVAAYFGGKALKIIK